MAISLSPIGISLLPVSGPTLQSSPLLTALVSSGNIPQSITPILVSSPTTSGTVPPLKVSSPSPSSPEAKRATVAIQNFEALSKAATKGLGTIQDYITQLNTLATQATSGTITDMQRAQLDTKFQGVLTQLKNFVANDTFQGKKLFDGKFTIDAGSSLGAYLFTGADNAPTKAQAQLTLPDMLSGLSKLSLTNPSNTANALTALQTASAGSVQTRQKIGDFTAAIQFADNTLKGVANIGPSITQVDTLNQAEQIAKAAATDVSDIQNLLGQLNSLAKQSADSSLSDVDRGFLNQQFASTLSAINTLVGQTASQGTNLLDGSLDYNVAGVLGQYLFTGVSNQPTRAQADLQIGNLDTNSLFDGSAPDILTQADAKNALTAIYNASNTVAKASTAVSNFTSAIDFARYNMQASNGDFSLSLLV